MRTQRTTRWMVAAALVAGCLCLLAAQSAAAPVGGCARMQRPVYQNDARIERTWLREWEKFAQFYLPFEDGFVCFPTYDPDRPSSNPASVEDYIRETAYEVEYEDEHTRDRTLTVTKPIEDAQAAFWLLYEPAVGQYGYVHSGEVEEIVSPREMVMFRVHLLDETQTRRDEAADRTALRQHALELVTGRTRRGPAKAQGGGRGDNRQDARQRQRALRALREIMDEAAKYRFADRRAAVEHHRDREYALRRWRVIGFSTENLVEQERWPQGEAAANGLHLAIVAVDDEYVTAVPAALLGRELTELQFLEVLESRGLTKAQFVGLINDAKREHGSRDYIAPVIRRMEGIEDEPEADESGETEEPEDDKPVNDTVELAD